MARSINDAASQLERLSDRLAARDLTPHQVRATLVRNATEQRLAYGGLRRSLAALGLVLLPEQWQCLIRELDAACTGSVSLQQLVDALGPSPLLPQPASPPPRRGGSSMGLQGLHIVAQPHDGAASALSRRAYSALCARLRRTPQQASQLREFFRAHDRLSTGSVGRDVVAAAFEVLFAFRLSETDSDLLGAGGFVSVTDNAARAGVTVRLALSGAKTRAAAEYKMVSQACSASTLGACGGDTCVYPARNLSCTSAAKPASCKGACVGGVPCTQGKVGTAPKCGEATFDGTSTSYDLGSMSLIKAAEGYTFSVDMWMYHEDPSLTNNSVLDFGNGDNNGYSDNIIVRFEGTGSEMKYEVYRGSSQQIIFTSVKFPTRTWTRVTVTHTAAKDDDAKLKATIALYKSALVSAGLPAAIVDTITTCAKAKTNAAGATANLCTLSSTKAIVAPICAVTCAMAAAVTIYWNGVSMKSGNVQLPNAVTRKNNYIGKGYDASGKLFKGKMSALRVWNQAVTLAQITAAAPAVAPAVAAFAPPYVQRNVGTAVKYGEVSFDGTNTWYDTGFKDLIKAAEGYTFSADLWMYHEDPKLDSNSVLDFGNAGVSDNIIVAFNGVTGKMAYRVYRGSSLQQFRTNAVFPTKTWTRVTVTHTAAKTVIIYWNGVPQMIEHWGGAKLSPDQKSATVHLPNEVTRKTNYVGKSNWGNHTLFKGKMKNLRVWNKAVTLAQIVSAAASVAPAVSAFALPGTCRGASATGACLGFASAALSFPIGTTAVTVTATDGSYPKSSPARTCVSRVHVLAPRVNVTETPRPDDIWMQVLATSDAQASFKIRNSGDAPLTIYTVTGTNIGTGQIKWAKISTARLYNAAGTAKSGGNFACSNGCTVTNFFDYSKAIVMAPGDYIGAIIDYAAKIASGGQGGKKIRGALEMTTDDPLNLKKSVKLSLDAISQKVVVIALPQTLARVTLKPKAAQTQKLAVMNIFSQQIKWTIKGCAKGALGFMKFTLCKTAEGASKPTCKLTCSGTLDMLDDNELKVASTAPTKGNRVYMQLLTFNGEATSNADIKSAWNVTASMAVTSADISLKSTTLALLKSGASGAAYTACHTTPAKGVVPNATAGSALSFVVCSRDEYGNIYEAAGLAFSVTLGGVTSKSTYDLADKYYKIVTTTPALGTHTASVATTILGKSTTVASLTFAATPKVCAARVGGKASEKTSTDGKSCVCLAGLARVGGVCKACVAGQQPNSANTACVQCKTLGPRFTSGTGKKCAECAAGAEANAAKSACTACVPGKFAAAASPVCAKCDKQGEVPENSSGGSAKCVKCVAGKKPNGDASRCVACAANEWGVDGKSCSTCAAGLEVNADKSTCAACAAGKVSPGQLAKCVACALGKAPNDPERPANCVRCLAGKASTDGKVCTSCRPGFESNGANTACAACGSGKYSGDGTACQTSAPGRQAVNGSLLFVKSKANGTAACAAGFASKLGEACIACAAGQQPNAAKSVCLACPAGKASVGGKTCDACQPGQAPNSGMSKCDTCGIGTFSAAGAACVKSGAGRQPVDSAAKAVKVGAIAEATYVLATAAAAAAATSTLPR